MSVQKSQASREEKKQNLNQGTRVNKVAILNGGKNERGKTDGNVMKDGAKL